MVRQKMDRQKNESIEIDWQKYEQIEKLIDLKWIYRKIDRQKK